MYKKVYSFIYILQCTQMCLQCNFQHFDCIFQRKSSRTYLPVRFVAENLGATVLWDGASSTATLTK